jgi:acetyl esterase/lipase
VLANCSNTDCGLDHAHAAHDPREMEQAFFGINNTREISGGGGRVNHQFPESAAEIQTSNVQRRTSNVEVKEKEFSSLRRWTFDVGRSAFAFSFLRLFCIAALMLQTGCNRFLLLDMMVPSTGYRATTDFSYGDLPRQKLDVYQPRSVKSNGIIVIFFYGGTWSNGEKRNYRFVGEALSSKGFIAVLPNYRLYPNVTFPAFVQDGARAVRWVHDHARDIGGDPQHVFLMGHSAGAHIASLITLDPRYLAGVGLDRSAIRGFVGLAGPYDFKVGKDLWPIFSIDSTTQPVNPAIQPINWVDGHEPPMLLLQGSSDNVVDPDNATRLADRIKKMGGKVQVIFYPGIEHIGIVLALSSPFRWLAPVLKDATEFFISH